MPKFTYTGDAGRYYTDLGLEPEPGQSYELETTPDGRWEPEDGQQEPQEQADPAETLEGN